MANELFKRTEVDFGGAMTSEKGMLTPNKGLNGVLMQNIGLQYQQNVTRLYEIGKAGEKSKVYYISGRASGQLSAGHVVGPGVAMKEFYDNFSDVCQAGTNDIELKLGPNICNQNTLNIAYNARFCVLVSIGVSTSAQEFIINQNAQLMFSGMSYTE